MVIKAAIPNGHVISLTNAAWGHAKCACALLAKMVRCRPIYATMFIAASLSEKATKEFDVQFLPDVEDDLRKLIRVVALESGPSPFDSTLLNQSFIKEYKKLLENGLSADSGVPLDGFEPGPPQLVILDFFLYETLQNIRAISGKSVPVYALQSASAAATIFLFGPEDMGGQGNLAEKLNAITHTDKEAIEEEAERILRRLNGELVKLPGIPPMYDHEHSPQKTIIPKGAGAFLIADCHKFFVECDGTVMNTSSLYEEHSIKAFQEWFGGKPVISAGPVDFPLIERQKTVSSTATEVGTFLDSALEKYGPNSVVYISFGSLFWMLEPEKLWAILDVMIEQEVPFIIAHASHFAVIPDEIKEKIKTSGLGYSSNWLPQTAILSHKACGWFVTHCGHNSVTEAISDGVPLICWPFDADQPTNAANVAFVHKLGYELFEVRTGTGLRPIHRLGDRIPEATVESVKREFSEVLEKTRGEDGAIKRANVQKFREGVAKLWAPGGENWQEIKRITDILQ